MMKSMNKVTENYKIIGTCHPDMTQCTLVLMQHHSENIAKQYQGTLL